MVSKYQRLDLTKNNQLPESSLLHTSSQVSCLVCSGCCNKLPQTGWLKQQTFLPVPEPVKSKIKMETDLILDEISAGGPLCLVSSHMESRDRNNLSSHSSYQGHKYYPVVSTLRILSLTVPVSNYQHTGEKDFNIQTLKGYKCSP